MKLNNQQFYNRDLSWLRFNHRVLQEAADARNPLYERLKFLAIFSSNLDEFFKVRVSDIRKIKQLDKPLRKKLITKPNKLLSKIKKQVDLQQKEFGRIFSTELLPALQKEGVFLKQIAQLESSQLAFVQDYYDKIKHLVNPTKEKDFTFLENEALYLVGQSKKEALVWVKISNELPRFVEVPTEDETKCIVFIDDIIRLYTGETFKAEFFAIKISRDAELYIDTEYSGDLLEKIQNALPNRDTGTGYQSINRPIDAEKTDTQVKAGTGHQ